MSSNAVAFNLVQPAQPGAVYSYTNEDLDCSVSWTPHPDLISSIRERLVDAVERLPRRYLLPPVDGEVFETLRAAEDRVLGYSLAAGFQIVRGSGCTAIRKNIWCIHHGKKTQNNRGLSEAVERDPKDKKIIVSTRKRDDTKMMGKNCLWRCFLVPFV